MRYFAIQAPGGFTPPRVTHGEAAVNVALFLMDVTVSLIISCLLVDSQFMV